MAESLTNDNNSCVVCFKNVVYYSIGECDHPVCYECSTRMRVLCLQNECPICRQALSRVVFTDTVQPYKELRTRVFTDRLFERQYKIGFCCEEIKQAYEQLLENHCKMCGNIAPFRTFSQLSDHMRKVHERYYCDLCVKHLKIFTSERRCYTRQELAHHRRKGDLDNTSHRGHPLCEFCEERFMDADELYRHLRKEHLYCHLCDADGKNLYYASHSALAQHFRTDHYLCEEGECAGNHLTAVFRTEIDLKAHKASVHGRGLARGASRQARTIELQFNITPHAAQLVPRAPREREQRAESPPPPPPPPARIDTRSDAHFPRLSAAPAAPPPLAAPGGKPYKGVDGLTRNERNFPSLGGGNGAGAGAGGAGQGSGRAPAAQVLKTSKPSVSIQLHSQPASASSFRLTQTSGHRAAAAGSSPAAPAPAPGPGRRVRPPLCDDDFPSLGGGGGGRDDHPSLGAAAPQPPKVGLINNADMQALKGSQSAPQPKRAALGAEAFPALGPAPAPAPAAAAPAQWVTVSKDKGKKHVAKTSPPPPPPREPAFNPAADFPTLPVNNKAAPKQKKTPQPQPQPQPPPQPALQPTKKEKKKQNSAVKKENSEPEAPIYVNGYDKFTNKQMKEAYNAAINMDENKAPAPQADRKIKTIEDTSASDKRRNGGIGDFALAPKDYPPLSAMSANAAPPPAPVPQAYVQHTRKEKRANGAAPAPAPPGYSGGGAGAGGACMTFTNSAGQTFPAPPHDYLPPPDFERRNRALVKRFADALGSAAAVEDFKVASRAFRDSIISADEFHAHCERAMGAQLDAVLPDLVALLPDIGKQQELARGRDVAARLRVCATCGQLLAPADAQAHDTHHWPPLSSPASAH